MRKIIDEKAQMALYDAVLFFIIIMIASTGLYITSLNLIKQTPEYAVQQRGIQDASDILNSVSISTVNETTYTKNGEEYYVYQQTVERTIQIYLEFEYLNQSTGSYSLHQIKKNITDKFDMGVRDSYNYAVHAAYTNQSETATFFISNSINNISQLPDTRYSAVRELNSNTTIALYIWK